MEVMSFESYGRLVVASWDDIMMKAKRLVMDNKVDVLTNRPEYVAGNVQGDHSDYNVEISRQDPNSGAITLWHCDCPWSQFSWGRTRQWKYLEGRPCSHTLALYWKALSTPIEAEEGYVPQPGQKGMAQEQMPEAPAQAPTLPGMEPALPDSNPLEEPVKPGLKDMTLPTQPGAPQKFVKAPGPKAPPQHQKLQLWNITDLPGQEEGAQYAPPVSVPGGAQPGPGNPVYIPGALSKVAEYGKGYNYTDPDGYLYHWAPAADRHRIQTHGLFPAMPAIHPQWADEIGQTGVEDQPHGLYVSPDPDVFTPGENNDLWRFHDSYANGINDDPLIENAYYIPHQIPPHALELHKPAEAYDPRNERDEPADDKDVAIWENPPEHQRRQLGIGFPDRVIGYVQPFSVVRSNFIWYSASDFEMQVQEMLRNGVSPVVTLVTPVEMEMRGGKIPAPGAVPTGMTGSGIPTYNTMDLGWDPQNEVRMNSDETNPVGPGAPEQRGATAMAQPGQRGIITDIMPYTKDVKVIIPLHDTGALHPHSLESWVEYKDVRILPNAPDPYVKRSWVKL